MDHSIHIISNSALGLLPVLEHVGAITINPLFRFVSYFLGPQQTTQTPQGFNLQVLGPGVSPSQFRDAPQDLI